MKIKRSLLFLLVFVSLTINVFGQEVKSEKPAINDFLSTEIGLDLKEVTYTELFGYLMITAETRGGFVELGSEKSNRFDINIEFTLRNGLDFIVASDTRYRWIEEKGIINLLPIEEPKVLSIRIQKFKAAKSTTLELIGELMETNEVKIVADSIGFKFGGAQSAFSTCGNVAREEESKDKQDCENCDDSNKTREDKKISVEFDNLTVRQILNEIMRLQTGWFNVWRYSEKRKVDDDNKEVVYFYIKA